MWGIALSASHATLTEWAKSHCIPHLSYLRKLQQLLRMAPPPHHMLVEMLLDAWSCLQRHVTVHCEGCFWCLQYGAKWLWLTLYVISLLHCKHAVYMSSEGLCYWNGSFPLSVTGIYIWKLETLSACINILSTLVGGKTRTRRYWPMKKVAQSPKLALETTQSPPIQWVLWVFPCWE